MADAMGATSQRLLDRCLGCIAVYVRLLNHFMASGGFTRAGAKSCSYYAPRHSNDERQQHDGKPLMHIRPQTITSSHKEAQKADK
jgi:hypothetical protein